MYRGFNIKTNLSKYAAYYLAGLSQYQKNKVTVENALDSFIAPDSTIDGDKLAEAWFPQINADIFLSHSHNDIQLAIAFAGWLKTIFNLNTFIDSTIWKHSDSLLKKIDQRFTFNKGSNTFDYEKRNFSTSHVHMMLSIALTKMIDRCECLFFLNTPNSISPEDVVKTSTYSPWIYAEISTVKFIEKKIPARLRRSYTQLFSKGGERNINESELFRIRHTLDMKELTNLSFDDLEAWEEEMNQGIDALKLLYHQHYTQPNIL